MFWILGSTTLARNYMCGLWRPNSNELYNLKIMNACFVYVLGSAQGRTYVGWTVDLDARLGLVSLTTREGVSSALVFRRLDN